MSLSLKILFRDEVTKEEIDKIIARTLTEKDCIVCFEIKEV